MNEDQSKSSGQSKTRAMFSRFGPRLGLGLRSVGLGLDWPALRRFGPALRFGPGLACAPSVWACATSPALRRFGLGWAGLVAALSCLGSVGLGLALESAIFFGLDRLAILG